MTKLRIFAPHALPGNRYVVVRTGQRRLSSVPHGEQYSCPCAWDVAVAAAERLAHRWGYAHVHIELLGNTHNPNITE